MSFLVKPSWRLGRRVLQLAFLAVFLWLFRKTEYNPPAEIPAAVNVVFRLDPLVAASAMLAAKAIIASLLLALVVVVLTFVLGRVFCGWVCPMGTLIDIVGRVIRPRRARSPESAAVAEGPGGHLAQGGPAGRGWRRVKYFLLALILVGAPLGLPLVGYFDPFSILVRALTFAVDPALRYAVSLPFDWLYKNAPEGVTSVTSEPIYDFLKSHLLPAEQTTYLLAGVSFAILFAIFALERMERRFWCRNLCPLGAMLAIVARPALLRRLPFKSCKGCADCESSCRMGAFDGKGRLVPEACNLCMDCVADCPQRIAKFTFRRKPRAARVPFEPSRRVFLAAAGTSLAFAAVLSLEKKAIGKARRQVLRPPGAQDEERLLDLCVRCGECMKVCPTNGLQPASLEAGWEGVFSPQLVPRLGQCEYNCTLCGEICPTGAIPRLTEKEKNEVVMGKAEFDKARCLPYARGEPCIVCEEHCPVPEKAIQVKEVEVLNDLGETVKVGRPYVVLERCVGCGICENQCPIEGPAGIRVASLKDAALTEEMMW